MVRTHIVRLHAGRSDAKCWLTKYALLFNQLEDSSNYSASVLHTNVAKNMSSITGRGIEKSNAIRIMTIMSSMLWRPLYTLFSYCFTLYRLGVMFRCCNNLSYIFIHTYFHCQASKVK